METSISQIFIELFFCKSILYKRRNKKKESNFIKSKCSIAEIVPKNVFLKNSFILNIVCI